MDRRRFLLTSLAGALAVPLVAEGQRAGRLYRIGLLEGPFPPIILFHQQMVGELYSLGYVEGKNVVFERNSAGTDKQMVENAAVLVNRAVDLIVASGLPASRAARDATTTIPIVMVTETDPVAAGLVSSLGRPGGNVTGVTLRNPELAGKRLELLKEAVPGLVRVAVLWNPGNSESVEHWQAAQPAARLLGLELRSLEMRAVHEIDSLFDTAARERCGAVIVSNDYLIGLIGHRIIALARAKRMPAMYTSGVWWVTVAGGLMSYGVNELHLLRRVAAHVDKILKGGNPADLPVEQPTTFDLILNVRTAKALGLTLPPSLLARADKIIE
jgi:putative tryptophan/tyrosine transport system substrate-binding protein